MKREREGRFTHIRVHLLRILWREGKGFHQTYQDPFIEDPTERRKVQTY